MDTLAKRIKLTRQDKGMSQEELAEKAHVSQSLITKLESGKARESRKITALAAALGVSAEWLSTGKGLKVTAEEGRINIESNAEWQPGFEFWDDDTPLSYDDIALPFFREVELSAGAGSCQVQENHGRKLLFSKRTLKSHGVSPEHAACVTVSGNSMEPILPDGATIGIDTSQTAIKDGKVYAIEHDGHLRVKRLYRMPGGKIRLNSYNKDEWPDEIVTPDEIRILGKVFWSSVLWN